MVSFGFILALGDLIFSRSPDFIEAKEKIVMSRQTVRNGAFILSSSSSLIRGGRPAFKFLSGVLATLISTLIFVACSKHEESSKLTSDFSREALKRFETNQFSEVVRKVFYGGFTIPVVALPRGAERGVLIYENGEISKDFLDFQKLAKRMGQRLELPENALLADKTLKSIVDFYREQFGRNSYDGNGTTVQLSMDVNRNTKVLSMFGENAAWISELNLFYFGAGGNGFKSFVHGSDVAGHEFTHAVISSTSNLEYVGQSGALNEHFADLFGEMFQASFEEREPSFLIGETIAVGDVAPLRNMLEPGLGLSAQPGHMSEIPKKYSDNCVPSSENDRCGVHNLSGIPNKFAAQVVKQLGWLKVRDIFYSLMTERLSSTATFVDYAREARKLSTEILSPEDAKVVEASLISVGL